MGQTTSHYLYIRTAVAFTSNLCCSKCPTYCFLYNLVFMDKLTVIFIVSRSGFSQLASQGSWGSKNFPMKGNSPGLLSRQKSGSGKPAERSLSSSPASSQSLLKLKKDAMTKNSGDIFLFSTLTLLIPIFTCFWQFYRI